MQLYGRVSTCSDVALVRSVSGRTWTSGSRRKAWDITEWVISVVQLCSHAIQCQVAVSLSTVSDSLTVSDSDAQLAVIRLFVV